MHRSRLLTSIFVVLLVAAAACLLPQPARAACASFTAWEPETGSGTSCAAAQTDCENRANSRAYQDCQSEYRDLCFTGTFELTSGCSLSCGVWTVDCHLEFACTAGPDNPQP